MRDDQFVNHEGFETMKPVAYVSLPIAEFREKVNDFGNDFEKLARWVILFSKTLAMMGTNEPKDDFAIRLLNEVDKWRKDKAEKMRQLRSERKAQEDTDVKQVVVPAVEVVKSKPAPKVSKRLFGDMQNVMLSDSEEMKLRERLGVRFDRAIEILSHYKASSGKKYKSDYAAILNWVISRVEEETKKGTNISQAQRLAIGMMGGGNV